MKPFKFSKKNREYTKWGKNLKEVRVLPKGKDAPAALPLPVEMDDETAQGVYANLAVVSHTQTEFLADFLFLPPGQAKARINKRMILTPATAKKLCAALAGALRLYEARFGPLKA